MIRLHPISTLFPHTSLFFFFNDTATTEIYTLSLHDALPICCSSGWAGRRASRLTARTTKGPASRSRSRAREAISSTEWSSRTRSEEHTSELQSRQYLVCRLLLEKKKKD